MSSSNATRLMILVGLLALSSPAWAHARSADLLEVYRSAVEHDAGLSAARHEHQALLERVPQAKASLLPSLSARASLEDARSNLTEAAPARVRSGMLYQVRLEQPLLRLDRWYALKTAQASAAEADVKLAEKEQALILHTAETYFSVLRALDDLAAAKAERLAFRRQHNQARGRLRQGAANLTDVLDALAAHDAASARQTLAERAVADALETLNGLTQTHHTRIAGVTHRLPVSPPEPNHAQRWVNQAMHSNLALLASNHAVVGAEQNRRRHQAEHLPSLDAVAGYQAGDNDRFGYANDPQGPRAGLGTQATVGLELNVPLFGGGLTRSRVRQASEQLGQREDEREHQRREVIVRTRNLHRAINTHVERIKAYEQSIQSSQAALQATRVGQTLGSRNLADVLDAQRRLYHAVREYNDARYDYIIDSLKLKQAAGSLNVQDLAELTLHLSRDYDPDRDFLPPAVRPAGLASG